MRLIRILVLALLAAAVLAPVAMPDGSASRVTLTARSSSFGKALFDGRGFVLYAFTRDKRASACYGACAKAWPPYFAPKGELKVGAGLKRALLGTVRRRNGRRQVTYAGKPLYFYLGDTRPGQILCQDVVEFGGRWLIVRPSGAYLR
jgi:predicted lipoprotein with Yx(FWY)xxD motif